jgi:competence protein ComEC
LGPLRAKVLNPTRDGSGPNADSMVLLFDIRGKEVLLTGDDTGPCGDYVADVCARGPPLYLLKVAHHGSRYATYASFLAQTRPRFAAISVGRNSYGHPSAATVARLRAAHATVYTTQTNGTVTVTFLASGAVRWSFGDSNRPAATRRSNTAPSASRLPPSG